MKLQRKPFFFLIVLPKSDFRSFYNYNMTSCYHIRTYTTYSVLFAALFLYPRSPQHAFHAPAYKLYVFYADSTTFNT